MMTADELIEAGLPTLEKIDYATIDPSGQILFLVEADGAPVFRVWALDAAVAHLATLPGCGETLLRTRPPGSLARVAILVRGEFVIGDVLTDEGRPHLRLVH